MSMEAVEHVTTEGDRWDTLAWTYYGDPWAFERIIAANPSVPIRPRLPGGLTIHIPVIEAATRTDDLPPWRR